MELPLVSIVVPVYNVKDYLSRCLDSVLSQSYEKYELLLVDDGSTDGSSQICDEYLKKDPRIQVFHKKNGGVSSARNLGIDNSVGELVMFIDSDDYLFDAEALEKLVDLGFDMVVGNFVDSMAYRTCVRNLFIEDVNSDDPKVKEGLAELLNDRILAYPWGKVFSMKIIKDHHIRFNEKYTYGEDTLFVGQFCMHISSIKSISDYIIRYLVGVQKTHYKRCANVYSFYVEMIEQYRLLGEIYKIDMTDACHSLSLSVFQMIVEYTLKEKRRDKNMIVSFLLEPYMLSFIKQFHSKRPLVLLLKLKAYALSVWYLKNTARLGNLFFRR